MTYANTMAGMMYGQYGFGFGILAWLTSLFFIGLLGAGIYWLIKSANSKKRWIKIFLTWLNILMMEF